MKSDDKVLHFERLTDDIWMTVNELECLYRIEKFKRLFASAFSFATKIDDHELVRELWQASDQHNIMDNKSVPIPYLNDNIAVESIQQRLQLLLNDNEANGCLIIGLFDLKLNSLQGFRQNPIVGISTTDLIALLFWIQKDSSSDRGLFLPSLCRTDLLQLSITSVEPERLVLFSVFMEAGKRLLLTVDPSSFKGHSELVHDVGVIGRFLYFGGNLDVQIDLGITDTAINLLKIEVSLDEITSEKFDDKSTWWILQRRQYRLTLLQDRNVNGKERLLEFDRQRVPELTQLSSILAD